MAGTATADTKQRTGSRLQPAAVTHRATVVPKIVSITVGGPRPLPSAGVAVRVAVTVSDGVSCTFLRQDSAFSSLYPLKTVSCVSGQASAVVPAISNAYESPIHLTYAVRVTGIGGITVQRLVTVPQAAAPQPQPVTAVTAPPPPAPPAWHVSMNWSGYEVPSTAELITSASGQFTVPTLNCQSTPDSGVGIWVGIGGDPDNQGSSDGALLQTGVTAQCIGGYQFNHGWFELVPSEPNYSEQFYGFPVTAGDSIQAHVYQDTNGNWDTRVDDLSTGLSGWMVTGQGWGVGLDSSNSFYYQGRTTYLTYGGGYTAEWIAEAFTQSDGSQVTLADYGTITFDNLRLGGLASWYLAPNDEVAMEPQDATTIVSTPSPPGGDGDSFSVSYSGP